MIPTEFDYHRPASVDEALELLWRTRIESEIRATPVVDNDQVFVRSVDGKLRSFGIADGNEQWVVSRNVPALSLTGNSEPLVQGELVFAGFDDGKLIAYDRTTGKTRWETTQRERLRWRGSISHLWRRE